MARRDEWSRPRFRWGGLYDTFLIPGQPTAAWSVRPMERKAADPARKLDPAAPGDARGLAAEGPSTGPAGDSDGTSGQSPRQGSPAPTGPTDGELVTQVLAGRRAGFDDLIRRYQRQAVAVSYRLLGNSHDALEVTQDAFLKAFSSLDTLQKPDAFGGWLMRIVSNLSLNYRRSRKTRSQLPLDDLLGPSEPSAADVGGTSDWMAQDADPVHMMASSEMGKRLQEALQELPEKQRL